MAQRNYNNVTSKATLSSSAAPAATTLAVTGLTNNPTVPFTATIDRNTVTEEIVLVTAVVGGSLTVTRGYDGTAATTHLAGATFEHTAIAADFREANLHVNTTAGAHGTTGDVVGTEGSQTLMDKTLLSPLFQSDSLMGDAAVAWSEDGIKNIFRGMDTNGDDVFLVGPTGKVTATAGTAPEHLVRKSQLDAAGVSLPTADTIVRRDANGRFRAADPSASSDVVTRSFSEDKVPGKVRSGTVGITPSAPNTPTSSAITFGTTYANPPVVVATPNTAFPGTAVTGVSVLNITTTGCDILVTRTNTSVTSINWIAVGV